MGEFTKQPINHEWALTKHPWEHPGCSSCSLFHCHHISFSWSCNTLTITPDSSPTASTFLVLIVTFSSSFPLCLYFPCVPINPFPCALLHTRLVRSNYRRAVQPPGSHTHSAHTAPLSLSLYQLGINLLKQRASWRAAHRGPCEVLPLHRSTLLPILRNRHIHPTSFPLCCSQNKIWARSIVNKTEESRKGG